MLSSTRIAISGAVAATVTAASTVAGVMIGHKYWNSRLGGGLLGFFVLAPIANAIAFPFHGPGALAAMQTMREVQDAMREAPLAMNADQAGSGATPEQRYIAAANARAGGGQNPPLMIRRAPNPTANSPVA